MPDEHMWPPEMPLLHLIAQERFHDPAFILGNRAGLEKLRDTLNIALLAPGPAVSVEVYTGDSGDNHVHVFCVPDSNVEHIPLGYTDKIDRDEAPWPDWMLAAR